MYRTSPTLPQVLFVIILSLYGNTSSSFAQEVTTITSNTPSFQLGFVDEEINILGETNDGVLQVYLNSDFLKKHKRGLFISAAGLTPILQPKIKNGKSYEAIFDLAPNWQNYLTQGPKENFIGDKMKFGSDYADHEVTKGAFRDTLTQWSSKLRFDSLNTFELFKNWCYTMGITETSGEFTSTASKYDRDSWLEVKNIAHAQIAMDATEPLHSLTSDIESGVLMDDLLQAIEASKLRLEQWKTKISILDTKLFSPLETALATYETWCKSDLAELLQDNWIELWSRRGDPCELQSSIHNILCIYDYAPEWAFLDYKMYAHILSQKLNHESSHNCSSLANFVEEGMMQEGERYSCNATQDVPSFQMLSNMLIRPVISSQVSRLMWENFDEACDSDNETIEMLKSHVEFIRRVTNEYDFSFVQFELLIDQTTIPSLWKIANHESSLPSEFLPKIQFVSDSIPGLIDRSCSYTYKKPQKESYRDSILQFLWEAHPHTIPDSVCTGPILSHYQWTPESNWTPPSQILPTNLNFHCYIKQDENHLLLTGADTIQLSEFVTHTDTLKLRTNILTADSLKIDTVTTSFAASSWRWQLIQKSDSVIQILPAPAAENALTMDFSGLRQSLQSDSSEVWFGNLHTTPIALDMSEFAFKIDSNSWTSSIDFEIKTEDKAMKALRSNKGLTTSDPKTFISVYESLTDGLQNLTVRLRSVEFAQIILTADSTHLVDSNLSHFASYDFDSSIDRLNELLRELHSLKPDYAKAIERFEQALEAQRKKDLQLAAKFYGKIFQHGYEYIRFRDDGTYFICTKLSNDGWCSCSGEGNWSISNGYLDIYQNDCNYNGCQHNRQINGTATILEVGQTFSLNGERFNVNTRATKVY